MLYSNNPLLQPWQLLTGGTIRRLEPRGEGCVTVEVWSALFAPATVRLRLDGVRALTHRWWSDLWDEPYEGELPAIVARRPIVGAVSPSRRGGVIVDDGVRGWMRLDYDAIAIEGSSVDELRLFVRGALDAWRAAWSGDDVHAAVREVVRASDWTRASVEPLVAAWRAERSSELAEAALRVDEAVRGEPPARLSRHAGAAELDAWCATWTQDVGAAVDELARCAGETFELLDDDFATFDAADAAAAEMWAGLGRCLGAVEGAAPDPRIARALEDSLRSPSDHWFHVNQVSHAVGPLDDGAASDGPSYADRLFPLLRRHADRGSADRLERLARETLIEADCNGAQMAADLRALATSLRAEYSNEDRVLPVEVEAALRVRAAV